MFVAGASAAVHADMGDQPAPEPSADLGFDVMPLPATPGYRSGVACMEGGPRCIAVGPSGRSEEHTSELQSLMRISYAVFCLKKKKQKKTAYKDRNTNRESTKQQHLVNST